MLHTLRKFSEDFLQVWPIQKYLETYIFNNNKKKYFKRGNINNSDISDDLISRLEGKHKSSDRQMTVFPAVPLYIELHIFEHGSKRLGAYRLCT